LCNPKHEKCLKTKTFNNYERRKNRILFYNYATKEIKLYFFVGKEEGRKKPQLKLPTDLESLPNLSSFPIIMQKKKNALKCKNVLQITS
jgi:hypothetical protein